MAVNRIAADDDGAGGLDTRDEIAPHDIVADGDGIGGRPAVGSVDSDILAVDLVAAGEVAGPINLDSVRIAVSARAIVEDGIVEHLLVRIAVAEVDSEIPIAEHDRIRNREGIAAGVGGDIDPPDGSP